MLKKQLFLVVQAICFVLLTAGCVSHKQYRTGLDPCQVKPAETACGSAARELHDGYSLHFVEFDDQGLLWDRKQLTSVVDTLRGREYSGPGTILLVFVHGWQHNAAFDDPNVLEFRKMLRRVHKLEYLAGKKEGRPQRKVAGVFVSWRGRSVAGDGVSNLTFWDRKDVANTVGHGAVTELLLQLENVQLEHLDAQRESGNPVQTRLILIGHSFGGQIVYSALSQVILDRFVDLRGEPPQTFGDLVVLVNPAFEAARYAPLRDSSLQRDYPAGQLPLVTIFTAKNDDATGVAFPLGRWFSTLFDKHRDSAEKTANRRAIGHYAPFITHSLTWSKKTRKEDEPTAQEEKALTLPEREQSDAASAQKDLKVIPRVKDQWLDLSSRDKWSLDFENVKLAHLGTAGPRNPFYVVSVDKEIIDGHGGIWKPEFANFLRRFILFSISASEDTGAAVQ